jgi:hypothetical protein
MKHRVMGSLTAALALVAATAYPASAGSDSSGFRTSAPPMLTGELPQVSVMPLITVGETLEGGYRFETIPDGIALDPRGSNTLTIYVNHETSLVPFPASASLTDMDFSDFDNAQLSRLVLKRGNGKVLSGEIVIPSTANYQRFCSNFFAGEAEGFEFPLVFTNEEATDLVNRTGPAWPAGVGAEQAGLVVAYNPDTDQYRSIYGMGRFNHENSVAVPGYDQAVIVSGDDTFSAPASQMYLYAAPDAAGVWNDTGHLYAFKADGADNDYGDFSPGESLSGSFIPVPDSIADGDQTGLESWSNANNIFQFIRVEDIAYDKNTPNVIYFADTGEPRALRDATTGRLRRGPSGTVGPFINGRIFKMVLDPNDPLGVLSLSVLIDGDVDGSVSNDPALIHQPDNVETTGSSLLLQEDPGSHNQGIVTARIWQYDLASGDLRVVASVDQSADPAARLGTWESSGIVDVSQYFGRGAFLVTVQAHTVFVDSLVGSTVWGPTTFKREGGQLLLLRVPGA